MSNQRRSIIETLIDPKYLSLLIPILMAVASAFLVHDRSISKMMIIQENQSQHVSEMSKQLLEIRKSEHKIQLDVTTMSGLFSQFADMKKRIRDLERQYDRLESKK